jgi:hypothetical protein
MWLQRMILSIAIALSFSSANAPAQRVKPRSAKRNISASKPSVYLSFVRFGKREPLHTNESNDGVWLRLHNNTRWSLVLNASGTGGRVFVTGKEEEIGMFFGVEEVRQGPSTVNIDGYTPPPSLVSPWEVKPQPNPTPLPVPPEIEEDCPAQGDNWCVHVCSVIRLPPGKSVMFSLPRETLCKNLRIYLVFNYSWETQNGFVGEAPEHRVYFYGSELLKKDQIPPTTDY